jgi:predicted ATPase/DNA-binding winged helix-turn-helix (wHTH) protein
MGEPAILFGPYRLLAGQRLLLEGDKPVRLGSRAFDILTALVERAGELVGKEELIARAWPKTFVDEANLKIQVSALRRALGDGQRDNRYVVNVVGRGYNFVAPIRKEEPSRASSSPTAAPAAPHNLPFATTRMIGRDEIVTTLVTQLSQQRLVTVVGPGGIGKTTVALAVAERMIGTYEHGVWMVDLAPLRDPGLVPSAVATVLGLEIRTEDRLPGLAAALRDRRVLLLLDNCEHVIDAAAGLAAAALSGTSGVDILATSREPLGVQGERVYRLGVLNSPEPSPGLTAAEAATFPAVQLFVERVAAIVEDFALTDANAPLVVAICRRLDGLPLAIEFAAPRVEVLGIEGLAAGLNDSLRLLGTQRRAPVSRHRTMQAVVDWSYGLLSQDEQRFCRALGIFAGGFTNEAAAAVVTESVTSGDDAIDRLVDLVSKSLVVADVSDTKPRFRLLDTTRAYAIEKLNESGERERLAHRHAEYYRDLFERAEAASEMWTAPEWLAEYGPEIDNLRAALGWAFSPGGETAIGVALTVASGLLWTRLSLSDECRRLTERALSALGPGSDLTTRHQMRLLALLGWALEQTVGATLEMRAAFSKILELSESVHDIKFKSLAMWGLWVYHFNNGEFATALDLAQKSIAEEGVDTIHSLAGERIISLSLHYLGQQSSSRRQIESLLRRPVDPLHQPHDVRSAFDHRITLRSFLSRILWLQGFPDQAMRMAEESVKDALALNHELSLANALVQAACPVAFFIGDLVAAEHFVRMLLDHATKHALGPWQAWGRCFEGMLLIKRGDTVTGLQRLTTAVSGLRDIGYAVYYVAFMGELAEALGRAGQAAYGLTTIDEALARSERSEERWCVAELLRIKGELVVLQGAPGASRVAEEYFRQSLDWSRQQEALSWELRTTTSLARLLRNQGRAADAIACLQPIYDRFTEGFGTADLVTAKQLLGELGTPDHD